MDLGSYELITVITIFRNYFFKMIKVLERGILFIFCFSCVS